MKDETSGEKMAVDSGQGRRVTVKNRTWTVMVGDPNEVEGLTLSSQRASGVRRDQKGTKTSLHNFHTDSICFLAAIASRSCAVIDVVQYSCIEGKIFRELR